MAVAKVDQDASQENSNSQNATVRANVTLASQLKASVQQTNSNHQDGLAVAVAYSDEVTVVQKIDPSAGEDGIDAASNGVCHCVRWINRFDQSNDSQPDQNGNTGTSPYRRHAVQRQLEQTGIAVALAVSDQVSVEQHGPLKAGQDGIRAVSRADASAEVTQEVTQNIERSQ